ncbi:hypothetical protein quinque_011760 [Culex quinquefasciatus]
MNVLQDKIASLDRRFKSKNVGLTEKLDQIADLLKKLSAEQYKLRLEKSSLEDTVEELRRELEAAKQRTESLEVSESMLNEVLRSEKIAFEEELSDAANRLKFESKAVELDSTINEISVKEAGLSLLESQLAEKAEQLQQAGTVGRRTIQTREARRRKGEDYDTLNEDFMSERDAEETLFDEKQAVKSQLTAKEKQLDIFGN